MVKFNAELKSLSIVGFPDNKELRQNIDNSLLRQPLPTLYNSLLFVLLSLLWTRSNAEGGKTRLKWCKLTIKCSPEVWQLPSHHFLLDLVQLSGRTIEPQRKANTQRCSRRILSMFICRNPPKKKDAALTRWKKQHWSSEGAAGFQLDKRRNQAPLSEPRQVFCLRRQVFVCTRGQGRENSAICCGFIFIFLLGRKILVLSWKSAPPPIREQQVHTGACVCVH